MALPALAVLGAVGCGGAPVRVRAYDPSLPSGQQAGAVYFLPKSRVLVAFDVKLDAGIDDQRCVTSVADCKYQLGAGQLQISNVTIGTRQLPDQRAGFVIETNGTFMSEVGFSGTFNRRGELTSLSAASQEHTLEFAAEGLSAISKLAGLVSMAGRTPEASIQVQARRRLALLTLLSHSDAALAAMQPCGTRRVAPALAAPPPPSQGEVKGKSSDNKPVPGPKTPQPGPSPGVEATRCASIDEIQRALEVRAELLAEIRELDEELSLSKTVHIACSFEPPDRAGTLQIKDDGAACPPYGALKFQLAQSGFDVSLPELSVRWASANQPDKGSGEAPRPAAAAPATYAGIVYRIPEWFVITVSKGEAAIAGDVVSLPQFGKLFTTSFDESDLRAGKELDIELHEGQGSLKVLSLKDKPVNPAEIGRVVDAVAPTTTAASVPSINSPDQTRRLIDLERAYRDAQREIDDLRRQVSTPSRPTVQPGRTPGTDSPGTSGGGTSSGSTSTGGSTSGGGTPRSAPR